VAGRVFSQTPVGGNTMRGHLPKIERTKRMKNYTKKIRLEKWHFYLLGVVLLNFGLGLTTGYRLNQNLTFILKIILYLTGLILFLTTLRPIRKITIYYSAYAISVLLTGLFFMFGGILLAILSSIVLYPIAPKQTQYRTATIIIYDRFQGFMAPCCSYEVVEPELYIFEKHLGYINIKRSIEPERDEFVLKNNTIIYKYKLDSDRQASTAARDTTEILNFE
jgi:hypothetical protein